MTARSVSPTSTPATRSVTGREAGAGTSTTKELSYLPDPRHRRRGGGQGPGQLEPETSDLGENHEADPVDGLDELESGITRVTGRLLAPLVLEPGRPGLLSPAPAPDGIEEVPVGAVRIRQGLLEGHRRHLGRPGPFVGGLRGRERGGELRLSGDLVPGLPGGLPGGEGSIEHAPRVHPNTRDRFFARPPVGYARYLYRRTMPPRGRTVLSHSMGRRRQAG